MKTLGPIGPRAVGERVKIGVVFRKMCLTLDTDSEVRRGLE